MRTKKFKTRTHTAGEYKPSTFKAVPIFSLSDVFSGSLLPLGGFTPLSARTVNPPSLGSIHADLMDVSTSALQCRDRQFPSEVRNSLAWFPKRPRFLEETKQSLEKRSSLTV